MYTCTRVRTRVRTYVRTNIISKRLVPLRYVRTRVPRVPRGTRVPNGTCVRTLPWYTCTIGTGSTHGHYLKNDLKYKHSGATGTRVYDIVHYQWYVRTYNVMSQLSDWKRAHMRTENHVCFGRIHGSQYVHVYRHVHVYVHSKTT